MTSRCCANMRKPIVSRQEIFLLIIGWHADRNAFLPTAHDWNRLSSEAGPRVGMYLSRLEARVGIEPRVAIAS